MNADQKREERLFCQRQDRASTAALLGMTARSCLHGAEDADGEHEECGDEREDSRDGDTDKAEGQRKDPDDRVEQQCDERQRPAEHEKYAEEQQLDHGRVSFHAEDT